MIIERLTICVLLMCLSLLSAHAQQHCQPSDSLKSGDLIFVTSPQANKITEVTSGIDGLPIDHVAIYYTANGKPRIVESVSDGGVLTEDLHQFIEKNEGSHAYVARVMSELDIPQSIINALAYVGRPYDFLYLSDNDSIYCSELVQFSYVDFQGKRIFEPIPMSFHDSSGRVTDEWKSFYRCHGMEVPEGQPGSNPGDLSRRANVSILFRLF